MQENFTILNQGAPRSQEISTFPLLLAPSDRNYIVHSNSDSFFFIMCQTELIASIRDCRIDTDLIHGMNC